MNRGFTDSSSANLARTRDVPQKARAGSGGVHPGAPGHRAPLGVLRGGRRDAFAPIPRHAARACRGARIRCASAISCWTAGWSAPPPANCSANWMRSQRDQYKSMSGRATAPPYWFDLILNAESMDSEQMVEMIQGVGARAGSEGARLSCRRPPKRRSSFRSGCDCRGMASCRPAPCASRTRLSPIQSEQIFANLLDFYRIAWEYEPRSFPVQWDAEGRVSESFTPDFYLPEFDLYVELTTMKQSLVTRKNRKIRLLRELYPHLNVQVFYQKDFENLIFKYGLAERPAKV